MQSSQQFLAQEKGTVFLNRQFLYLFISAIFSAPGYYVYLIGVEWLMLSISDDRFFFGMLFLSASIPRLIFMTTGGILADHINQRTILMWSDITRAFLVLLLLVLIWRDSIAIWHLITLAALFGLSDAFSHPAINTLTAMILDEKDLQQGNSLIQVTTQISPVLGPVVGGSMIYFLGFMGVFTVAFTMMVVAALIVMRIKLNPVHDDKHKEGFWNEFREGIQYVKQREVLRSIMIMAFFLNFFVTGPMSLGIPIIVKDVFGANALGLTTLEVSLGGGALFGAFVLTSIKNLKRPGVVMLGCIAAFGGLYALTGLALNLYVNAGLLVGIGLLLQFVNIPLMTMVQRTTDKHMLGRVISLLMTVSTGLVPVSYFVTSLLIGIGVDIQLITMIGGSIVLLLAIMHVNNRTIMNYRY
ncbi:MFS transporter [Thalassobacillus sp. CUG 92003]|uniref:MFS transporter n=1 Tax=Thalassobacillus sp. CUG 92003 TaxID=2736641 RepID=UPI00351AA850